LTEKHKIVVIPGDGVGKEAIPEAVKVLKATEEVVTGLNMEFINFPAGGEYYLETGKEWPDEAFPTVKEEADAILFGAIGWITPSYELVRRIDGVLAGAGVIFGLRFGLDLYKNVRPVKLYPGVASVLVDKGAEDIDMVIVRENTEGLYQPIRGVLTRGEVEELAVDVRTITRKGAERIVKSAFELCKRRRKGTPKDGKLRVSCVDKSNVLRGCAFFRSIYNEVATNYPYIERDYAYVDAFCQWMIRSPEFYDVVVTTNMFGDIVTDLGAAMQGGMGMAPAGNIGDRYAMFEPIHGSSPLHAGKGEANPMASILAAKMMLEWLGEKHREKAFVNAATKIEKAVTEVLKKGEIRTYDLCRGRYSHVTPSSTAKVGDAVANTVRALE